MIESLSYYLLPDLDLDEMKPSLEYAAELGATYALVIGRDDDWSRQRDNFGRFCDVAAGYGLIVAIEAPVGTLSPISAAFRVIDEAGRTERGGVHRPDRLPARGRHAGHAGRAIDPRCCRIPRSTTASAKRGARMRPGDGEAQVDALLDALPAERCPLSLEWPAPKDAELRRRRVGHNSPWTAHGAF